MRRLVWAACAAAVSAGVAGQVRAADPLPNPARVYLSGNSLTDGLLWGKWDQAFASKGRQVTWGTHLIWGTPMDYMWEHGQPHDHDGNGVIGGNNAPGDELTGGYSKIVNYNNNSALDRFWRVLPTQTLDVASFQPFDRKATEDFGAFANYLSLLKQNPGNLDANGKIKTRIVFFTKWSARTEIRTDVTPGDGVDNKVTVGFQPFDLTQKWLDVNNTGTSDDDYRGTGWDELTGNSTRDYSLELLKGLRDPNAVGKKDGGTAASTATYTLPASVKWGHNLEQSFVPQAPASMVAEPIRLIPVADTFAEFERLLRLEAAATSIGAVEAKYGLTNTAEDPANGSKDPIAYNNLGDLNFAEHLFHDGIHINALGHYLQMLATYAVMFGEDPRGMSIPELVSADPDFLALAGNIAWDVVLRDAQYTMVPEPGTLGLAAIAGLALLRRRRN